MKSNTSEQPVGGRRHPATQCGQIVLVLQGGGALGAYQVGVYQAMHEVGCEPEWVIGTSIGAINGSIIAGNKPRDRLARLDRFWNLVQNNRAADCSALWRAFGNTYSNLEVYTRGIAGIFSRQIRRQPGECILHSASNGPRSIPPTP